jgi:hypothetical protein
MNRKLLIAALILIALSIADTDIARSAPIVFTRMNNPTGVVVDQAGNVYVQSFSEFGGGLFKFDANGNLIAQNNQLNGKFRLSSDLLHGVIWAQEINGNLYYIDPNTLQAQLFIDLKAWIINNHLQEPVFNILSRMPDILLMNDPVFGDIATRQVRNDQLDLLITGLTNSSGGMPFVLRLSFKDRIPQKPEIVVASIPSSVILPSPLDTYPYGIAVNSNGLALTVLPKEIDPNSVAQVTQLFLVTFGADFPNTADATSPSFIQAYENNQAFSTGMTASNKDNGFYVATVANSFGCGAGPAVLYFPHTFDSATCIADLSSLGLGNIEPADIAIDPNNQFLYVTMTQDGSVLRLDIPSSP